MSVRKAVLEKYFRIFAITLGLVLGILALVQISLDELVGKTILGQGRKATAKWADGISQVFPEPDSFFQGEPVTDAQRSFFEAVIAGSNIYRMTAYDKNGTLILDTAAQASWLNGASDLSTMAASVAASGERLVSFVDGRGSAHEPRWSIHTFQPFIDGEGEILGVLEFSVNVALLGDSIRTRYSRLSIFLVGTLAVIYLVPAYFLLLRNEQIRLRDRQLLELSRIDGLTGVLNRSAFSQRMTELFGARKSENIGALFIDVDHFKGVNDTYGHDFGDQILKKVATAIVDAVGGRGSVGRFGGDEFVVLLKPASQSLLEEMATGILEVLSDDQFFEGQPVRVSVSVGGHISPPGEDARQALRFADVAAYRAKSEGRGRFALFTDHRENDLEKRGPESRGVDPLRHAR